MRDDGEIEIEDESETKSISIRNALQEKYVVQCELMVSRRALSEKA